MTRARAWMPLYIADYLADTAHLDAAQSGAYLHLIMAYWRAGGPLRLSGDALARTARMSPEQWADAAPTILAFFNFDANGRLQHARIDRELAEAEEAYASRVARTAAASAARRAKADRSDVTSNVTTDVTSNVTTDVTTTQPQPQPQPQSPTEISNLETGPNPGGSGGLRADRADRGSRLPEDWAPSPADEAFAAEAGVDAQAQVSQFRDYWRARPGAGGRKSDWSATWRNWVRKAAERRAGNGTADRNRNGFIVLAEARARADRDRAARREAGDLLDDGIGGQ